jgi:hypothetical protein
MIFSMHDDWFYVSRYKSPVLQGVVSAIACSVKLLKRVLVKAGFRERYIIDFVYSRRRVEYIIGEV